MKAILNFVAVLLVCVVMWILGFVAGQAHPQYKWFDFGMKKPVVGAPVVPDAKVTPSK